MARGWFTAVILTAGALALPACGDEETDATAAGSADGGPGLTAEALGAESVGDAYMASSDPDAPIEAPAGAARREPGTPLSGVPRASDILAGIDEPSVAVRNRARASCKGADADASSASASALESTIACLINAERASRGIRPLKVNGKLRKAARGHSGDMVRQSYFSHTSRDGRDVVDRVVEARYLRSTRRFLVGENIGYAGTPSAMLTQWIKSRPHRANMLDRDYRDFGIGAAAGHPVSGPGDGGTFTAVFASPPR